MLWGNVGPRTRPTRSSSNLLSAQGAGERPSTHRRSSRPAATPSRWIGTRSMRGGSRRAREQTSCSPTTPVSPVRRGRTVDRALGLCRGGPSRTLTIFLSHGARSRASPSFAGPPSSGATRSDAQARAPRRSSSQAAAAIPEQPLRERLRGSSPLLCTRSGRQADALRGYDTARTTLRDELGVDPGPGLQAPGTSILDQDPALSWSPPPGSPQHPGTERGDATGAGASGRPDHDHRAHRSRSVVSVSFWACTAWSRSRGLVAPASPVLRWRWPMPVNLRAPSGSSTWGQSGDDLVAPTPWPPRWGSRCAR